MVNQLQGERSPYLLQHADNPVDWYPWGDEALERARAEDKPIFLSIGYSACHWCHVMAHESFEDEATAALLNEHFVSVKVDREERPDLDRIYMAAVQAMTGHGGWPMSVFLTPDGEPFYGGTYYPPEPRHGMPSFSEVLRAVIDAWENRRDELISGGRQLIEAVEQQMSVSGAPSGELHRESLDAAFDKLRQSFDWERGGWGTGPKFPQPMALEFLLRYGQDHPESPALDMVSQTLRAMARGGIYDQLGGGFHRYSVDDRWLVPHFEKMLYDNALLARVYLHAWQVTGESLFRAVVEETLDYVAREMTSPDGGFYATQDADTDGEEGAFFLWTASQIEAVLDEDAERFIAAYGVTQQGNFEGRTILSLVSGLEERAALAGARRRLFEAREQRPHPATDDKVIVSWNGLMLAAFAEAARVLDRADYRQVAKRNAAFLLDQLRAPDGHLYHVWRDEPGGRGFLDDYAHLMAGLLALYRTTFDARWYAAARGLAEHAIEHFAAPDWGFFDTSDDHEELIVRPRELQDNAVPSGNAMMATALQPLAVLATAPRYDRLARQALAAFEPLLARHPLAFGQWLNALDDALAERVEVAIIGPPAAADVEALLDVIERGFAPHRVLAIGEDGSPVPLLQGRERSEDRVTAYVCFGATCRPPVNDPQALRALLDRSQ